jgi:protein TonB
LEIAEFFMLRRISLTALLVAIAVPAYAQTNTGGEWHKQVVLRLNGSKRFPVAALGQSGTARVSFIVDRNGKLVSHWLEESSGVPAFDEESLALVERAQPFPAPPPDLDESGLTMTAPLIFGARYMRHHDTSVDISKIREISHGEAQVESKMRSICRGC